MDNEKISQIKLLFEEARELNETERENFLNLRCGFDQELKNEILSLLASFEETKDFLEEPFKIIDEKKNIFVDPLIGKQVGNFIIEGEAGVGGMGIVYAGRRNDKEYEQKVAIKILKYGFTSAYHLKRFQIERQTLANLQHSNIARLLDGGRTFDGLPYLVMEFIDGKPVTKYCEEKELNSYKKLEIFRQICAAVQYAHQNLIIHRDIKPGNILVTSTGTPKLLDFGIAKLINADLDESNSNLTRTGTLHLTPEYASPEQIKGEKVNTASDIYSLGVLLYQLMTGLRPYKITNISPKEITKVVTGDNILRPSERVKQATKDSSSSDNKSIEEDRRDYEHAKISSIKLSNYLKGDLDNIILKAMHKDPERRYVSVEQFSEDIRRHLAGLPVIARKDTMNYRASKFISRHKFGAAATFIITLLLITGLLGISWQANIAASQRDKAQNEAEKVKKINSFLQQMLSSPDPTKKGKDVKVVYVLNEAVKKIDGDLKTAPKIRASIRTTIGLTFENLGFYKKAITQLRKALATREKLYGEQNIETAKSIKNLALAFNYRGDYTKARNLYEKSISLYKKLGSTQIAAYAEALNDYGTLLMDLGKDNRALKNFKAALSIYQAVLGKQAQQVASAMNNMALIYDDEGKHSLAEKYYKEALKMDTKILGKNNYELVHMINNLGFVLFEKKKYAAAIDYFEKSYNIRKKILGTHHPDFALATYNLGCMYYYVKKNNKALQMIDSAIAIWRKTLSADHPLFGNAYYWKGKIYNSKNEPHTALTFLQHSLKIRIKLEGGNKYLIARTKCEIGRSYMLEGKFKKAESIILKNFNIMNKQTGKNTIEIQEIEKTLVNLYSKWNKPAKAKKYTTLLRDTPNN